jgi:hypothetical protein
MLKYMVADVERKLIYTLILLKCVSFLFENLFDLIHSHAEINRSSTAQVVLKFDGGHQSSKENLFQKMRRSIRAKGKSKLKNETDGTRETSNMQDTDDPSFKRSTRLKSVSPITQVGKSTFYLPSEDFSTTSPVEPAVQKEITKKKLRRKSKKESKYGLKERKK